MRSDPGRQSNDLRRDFDGLLLRANGTIRPLATGDDVIEALGSFARDFTCVAVPGWADQGYDLWLFVLDDSPQAVNVAATMLAETTQVFGDAIVVDDGFVPLPREVIEGVLALPNSRLAVRDTRRCRHRDAAPGSPNGTA